MCIRDRTNRLSSILSTLPNHLNVLSFILSFTPFFTPHNPLIRSFLILSNRPTPNTPLRLSIRTHCTLDLYLLFQTIVSLLYINTGNNMPSCKTLAHLRLSPFASTNDLIAPATFLPFTIFLLHSALSVPFSFNIYPKYLNSDTCSSCSPSNITSHQGLSSLTTITLLLSTFTFKPLLLHTLPNLSTNLLKLSSDSPHRTKSSAYNR